MKKYSKIPVKGGKALEMTMKNVLDGLEDSASYFAYQSTPAQFEILSIEAPKGDPFAQEHKLATIHHVPSRRSEDIVEFLMIREERAAAARI